MHFNPSKCQIMHICKSPNTIKTQYVLHGQVLEAVEHAKYLGLDIGNKLNWNHHIQNVTTKANKPLGYLRRNIRTKHKCIPQTAYQTLVRPQVEYASPYGALTPIKTLIRSKLSSAGQHAGSPMTTLHTVV